MHNFDSVRYICKCVMIFESFPAGLLQVPVCSCSCSNHPRERPARFSSIKSMLRDYVFSFKILWLSVPTFEHFDLSHKLSQFQYFSAPSQSLFSHARGFSRGFLVIPRRKMRLVRFLRRNLQCIFGRRRRRRRNHVSYYYNPQSGYKDLVQNHLRCGSVDSIDCNCHSRLNGQLDCCDQCDQDSERSESTEYVVWGSTPAQIGADNRYFVKWRRASTCIISSVLWIQSRMWSVFRSSVSVFLG